MSITKETELLEVTVAANGVVFYEEATKVIEDGVEISRKSHRTILNPGADLTGHPSMVVSLAQTTWTPEVIAAYQLSSQPRAVPQGA